jgi:ribosomal protein L16 Arg81 hydroxylase
MLSFSDLISPMNPDDFFAEHWRKKVKLFSGDSTRVELFADWNFFSQLLELKHLRFEHKIQFVRDGYDIQPPVNVREAMEFTGFERINYLCQDQVGLKFCHLQYIPSVFEDFSLNLHNFFEEEININAYLSPPQADNALAPHADPYDVFALQLFGKKSWKFGNNANALSEPCVSQAGDVLYIPKGLWHYAANESHTHSLHLTIGVLDVSAKNIIQWIGERALQNLKQKRASPQGQGQGQGQIQKDSSQIREQQVDLVVTALKEIIDDDACYTNFMKDHFKKSYVCSTANPKVYIRPEQE